MSFIGVTGWDQCSTVESEMSESVAHTSVKIGSDRNFGFVFGGALAVLSMLPLFFGSSPWLILLAVGAVFIVLALVWPSILHWPNRLWFKFGLLLHSLISPLVLLLIYVIAFLPTGCMLRLFGKDPLMRRFEPEAGSYWTPREKQPGSMKRQY